MNGVSPPALPTKSIEAEKSQTRIQLFKHKMGKSLSKVERFNGSLDVSPNLSCNSSNTKISLLKPVLRNQRKCSKGNNRLDSLETDYLKEQKLKNCSPIVAVLSESKLSSFSDSLAKIIVNDVEPDFIEAIHK